MVGKNRHECSLRKKKQKHKNWIFHSLTTIKQWSRWLTTLVNFHSPQTAAAPSLLPALPSVRLSIYLIGLQTNTLTWTHSCASLIHSLINGLVVSCRRSTRIITNSPTFPPRGWFVRRGTIFVGTVASDWRGWRKSIHSVSFSRMIRKSRSSRSIDDALWKCNNSWWACVAIDRNCFPVERVFAFRIQRLLRCHFVGCYYLIYSKSIPLISLLFLSALLHFSNPGAFPWRGGKSDENISLL